MENFFAGLNTPDSYAILFFLLIAFLLGLVVGLLLRGQRISKLKQSLKEANEQKAALEAEAIGLREQFSLKEADIRRLENEKADLLDKLNLAEEEKSKAYLETSRANNELHKCQASYKELHSAYEQLQNQYSDLHAAYEQLDQVQQKEDDKVNDVASMQSLYNATRMRMETIEEKLARLESENQALQQSLQSLAAAASNAAAPSSPSLEFAEEPEYQPNDDKSVLRGRIDVDQVAERDDLSLIVGVGDFLARKLNETGVYTFEQIAQWNEADVERITNELSYFPGRILKDDWIGQAQRLVITKQKHPWALQPLGAGQGNTSDLKIIEGIGPKIEQLLKDAGINTWQELADSSVEHLEAILAEAGDAFRIHHPGTWPNQARMAANGQWALLKEYQDELKGGRSTT